MSAKTSNIGLTVTPASDTAVRFLDWRAALDGDVDTSNMEIIDREVGAVKSNLTAAETALSTL